ncbi:MAG: recombinase family protein [Lachnospira sp.]|nr:recombinase family protein [Lachnospira sp.]
MHDERLLEGLVCDIYNRCSTTEETQNRAIEVQAAESRELVAGMGGILYKQYVEQESGTSTKKRSLYSELLADVSSGRIDCIVVKSIDRLMRNAGDWHEFVNLITVKGVRLYLYLERKFYEPEDAFLSGIKALIAEQYSRELSQKVNNAHKRRQRLENGRLTLVSHVYGYEKRQDEFIVNETEAEYIRQIYCMSANGIGSRKIAKKLSETGFRGKSGGEISAVTIRRIIRNPLYMGTVVMNKTHYDFERKKTIKNPKEEWIYHKGRVPAIVTEELWQAANKEMEKRKTTQKHKEEACVFQESSLSGKIYCGICNKPFYRKVSASGESFFICSGQQQGKCKNTIVYETELENMLKNIVTGSLKMPDENDLYEKQEEVLYELLKCVLKEDTGIQAIYMQKEKALEDKKKRLLNKLADEIISDGDFQLMNKELEIQRQFLQKEIRKSREAQNNIDIRLNTIKQFMTKKDTKEKIFRCYCCRQIQGIEVKPKGILNIYRADIEEKVQMQYFHRNKKTLQKETKTEELYNYIKEAGEMTTEQLSEKSGLSHGNVLLKLKELKGKSAICFVSRGRNGGYWKISD